MTNLAASLAEIRSMVKNNDHTEAHIAGCELLGPAADEIKAALCAIHNEQRRTHDLSPTADRERYALLQQMLTLAKARLGDDYEAFRMSF